MLEMVKLSEYVAMLVLASLVKLITGGLQGGVAHSSL